MLIQQSSDLPAMAALNDSDNDSIFQFDPDTPTPQLLVTQTENERTSVSDILGYISTQNNRLMTETVEDREPVSPASADKGKCTTTLLTMSPDNNDLDPFPPFGDSSRASISLDSSVPSPLSHINTSPLICTFPEPVNCELDGQAHDIYPRIWDSQLGYDNLGTGKGKGKETPSFPASPAFMPPELDTSNLEYSMWSSPSSPTPGPSHQGSPTYPAFSPPSSEGHNDSSLSEASPSGRNSHFQDKSRRMPSRRQSLSNLSLFKTKSQPMLGAKTKWNVPRIPGNLSRTFLFKKRELAEVRADLTDPIFPVFDPSVLQYPSDVLQKVQLDGLPTKSSDNSLLKTKGRSQSLPQPLSPLDYVPTSSLDIYEPIPLVIKNYFDDELPRELRLRIFKALIELHELDFRRLVASGKWSVAKASSSKWQWVGRDKGMKELFKLSRVSKSWQKLVSDGQLWTSLDLQAFPVLPESALRRLSEAGYSFIRSMNLAGHVQLHSSILMNIADNLRISPRIITRTQLTTINLQGCTLLTTRSLHHLLELSESLQTLNVKGLSAVTNTTCDILSTFCPLLANLNMSRCPNLDAEGIQHLASTALGRDAYLKLKTLRVSGLKNISDKMMATLGKAAPYLEVLDLSYARQLHNSAIEALVSWELGDRKEAGMDVISLTAREAGRETGNRDYYARRVTHLRHINVSHCILLTDMACSNLAYSVPRLEFFEIAGIGTDLKDDGLIRLFRTTPHIRRIDLEDASDVTDRLLEAITPDPISGAGREADPQPGHALEHLILSHANHISDDAFLPLIQNCPRLKCLEADNTRVSASALREFVELSRERNLSDAKIVAVDCRGISDNLVKELSGSIRPRMGQRSYATRKLMYLDARDDNIEELRIGQDECDEKRVVVKSFYTWQTVDAVHATREKRRRSTKRVNGDGSDLEDPSWRTRWWSPSGRRLANSGRDTPQSVTDSSDGCQIM